VQPSAVIANADEPLSESVSAALAEPPVFLSRNVSLLDAPLETDPKSNEFGVNAIDGVWEACPADANTPPATNPTETTATSIPNVLRTLARPT
jgi:hypothetical protein